MIGGIVFTSWLLQHLAVELGRACGVAPMVATLAAHGIGDALVGIDDEDACSGASA